MCCVLIDINSKLFDLQSLNSLLTIPIQLSQSEEIIERNAIKATLKHKKSMLNFNENNNEKEEEFKAKDILKILSLKDPQFDLFMKTVVREYPGNKVSSLLLLIH